MEGYSGNPFFACHVECVQNSDCPLTKACSNHKCVDPCHSACGTGASCDVINHYPVCFCDANLSGDPFVHCYPHKEVGPVIVPQSNPCDPSPCGPNSRCLISPRGYATCSCLPDFRGSPPLCNPECIVSSDCLQIQACINNKCVNPCNGICGHGALCLVINHNPVCSCPATYEGDPFVACVPMNKEELEPTSSCHPSLPDQDGPSSVLLSEYLHRKSTELQTRVSHQPGMSNRPSLRSEQMYPPLPSQLRTQFRVRYHQPHAL
ncbi:GSCOCG00008266001-RA-CDS, partial [Cotesia congregata]